MSAFLKATGTFFKKFPESSVGLACFSAATNTPRKSLAVLWEQDRRIEDACFEGVYRIFEGHTWYVQRLLNELYAWTAPGEGATAEMLPEVVAYVVKKRRTIMP